MPTPSVFSGGIVFIVSTVGLEGNPFRLSAVVLYYLFNMIFGAALVC